MIKKISALIVSIAIVLSALAPVDIALARSTADVDRTAQKTVDYCDDDDLSSATIKALAEAFGITTAELKADLADGESLTTIGKDNGFTSKQIATITEAACGDSSTVTIKDTSTRWVQDVSGNWNSTGYYFNRDVTNHTQKAASKYSMWPSLKEYYNYTESSSKSSYQYITWKGLKIYF